ncbi:MAG: TetR family transcriptional regulator [Candidatus Limnocylindrales bacterium]
MVQTSSRPKVADDLAFGVSELAARTGIPVPTIHHYRKLGLLPAPVQTTPSRFTYDERHVAALGAIRALRAHQVPLDRVRTVLPGLLAAGVGLTGNSWESLISDTAADADPGADRLLDAARSAFARHGYDGVSVGEICDAAGMAKGTFYRYFDSKDAIFVAAARSTVEAVGEELERRGGSLSEAEALGELESLLAPLAPLILEAATRELRHEPRSRGIVASVAQGLAAQLGPRLRAQGSRAIPAARRVVETVLLGLVRPALGLR